MKKLTFFFLFSILVFLSSCGSKEINKEILNLGVMSSMDYLPLAVAQREGYTEELGLKLNLRKFYSANERDAAFQSGNVDGVVIDFTGAVLQKAGGIKLKLTSKCDAPFYIVSSQQSRIDSISQLKEKKVAVSQHTVIDYCVDMALASVGLTASDIEKIEINKIPVRFEMLRNHQIDATGLPNPFAMMAVEEGDRIVTSNAELGFSITGIMFSENALQDKSEMIKKMYRAYNMGVNYLNSHTVGDIQDILVKELGFPENIAQKTVLPVYTHAAMPSDKDIQSVTDWLVSRNLIDPAFDKSTLLYDSFVK